jgi:hypothetical protein
MGTCCSYKGEEAALEFVNTRKRGVSVHIQDSDEKAGIQRINIESKKEQTQFGLRKIDAKNIMISPKGKENKESQHTDTQTTTSSKYVEEKKKLQAVDTNDNMKFGLHKAGYAINLCKAKIKIPRNLANQCQKPPRAPKDKERQRSPAGVLSDFMRKKKREIETERQNEEKNKHVT